jgi:hypothetical protein
MTLETVHFHTGVGVATLTELARCIDWNRPTIWVGARMTGYTFDQTVPFGTDALVHGPIALMQ